MDSFQFSPVGHYFATADRSARVWSMERTTPMRILAGHLSDVDVRNTHRPLHLPCHIPPSLPFPPHPHPFLTPSNLSPPSIPLLPLLLSTPLLFPSLLFPSLPLPPTPFNPSFMPPFFFPPLSPSLECGVAPQLQLHSHGVQRPQREAVGGGGGVVRAHTVGAPGVGALAGGVPRWAPAGVGGRGGGGDDVGPRDRKEDEHADGAQRTRVITALKEVAA